MRVLWFERNEAGFWSPGDWDRTAVAMTSTHDLPTVAGWWSGGDIAVRAATGRLCAGVTEDQVVRERATERPELWTALREAGAASGDPPATEQTDPVVDAALEFVAHTRSPLCLLPIEDVLGVRDQPNLPGTIDEHPNWRRRLPRPASTLLDEPRVAARLQRLAQKRPRQ